MEILIIIAVAVVIVLVASGLMAIGRVDASNGGGPPVVRQTTRAASKPDVEKYIEPIDIPADVLDIRALDSRRMRVVGTGNYSLPKSVKVWTWMLVREPRNKFDANAIAVRFPNGRKAGYVSASAAEALAPLLDETAYSKFYVAAVGSAGTTSTRVWVDLPRVPALRAYVKRVT